MVNKFFKALSMLLAVVLLVNMLPLGIMAQELQSGLSADASALAADTAQTAETADLQDAQIVAEIPEKRTEYTKEFLLSNGVHMATVYADPVHYQTDKGWEDIDNTLNVKADGTYTNTAGIWDVSFPQKLTKDESITIQKDGYTLSFYMAGELNSDGSAMLMTGNDTAMTPMAVTDVVQATAVVQAPDLTAMKEAAEFEETVLEKVQSQIAYENVFENTDVIYNLDSNKVKESLVLQSYSDTLRGYQYTLEIGEMIPALAEDGTITFYDRTGKNVVMVMPAPFLIDNNGNCCNDIQVVLEGENGTYTMTYLLPVQWLGAQDRAWPVVLDPAVEPALDRSNIRDVTVMSKNQDSHDNNWNRNGVGKHPDNGIMRTYLKYRNLPVLTSADVIIKAEVTMYKPDAGNTLATVEVHKVNNTWESETLVWDDQNEKRTDGETNTVTFDSEIEDYVLANPRDTYTWNVTDIVRDWYAGENTGMMFKLPDAIEDGNLNSYKHFYSSDATSNEDRRPNLTIYFRNNNGLESYWDYTSASAGRAGTGYVNNFTGNLVWVRSDLGFSGCIMPVFINHVYNLNDANNNDFGLGNGWRTNYHERAYVWTVDDDYYVWEDEDGTDHYFKKSEDEDDGDNVYKDEDDLGLTLTVTNTDTKECTIKAKTGNTRYFDSLGRLVKIENDQPSPKSIEIIYDENSQKITKIKDGANREYCFNYNADGMLVKICYCDLEENSKSENTEHQDHACVKYEYTGGNLTKVTDEDGGKSNYQYNGHVLTVAEDIDGYQLSYSYYEPTQDWHPYRVRSISEKAGTKNGGCINITYDHNQTVFTDHKGQKEIHQFDDFGHTICIQDDQGRAQYAQFSFSTDAEKNSNTDPAKENHQLTLSSELQYTVCNLLETNNNNLPGSWATFGSDTTCDDSTYSYLGRAAVMFDRLDFGYFPGDEYGLVYKKPVTVEPHQTQTFSCYVKSKTKVFLRAQAGTNVKESEMLNAINTDWHRLQVSYTNDSDQAVTVRYYVVGDQYGPVHVACPQLEISSNASRYNLIANGDFTVDDCWEKTNFGNDDGFIARVDEDRVIPQMNTNVLQITGDPTKQKYVTQTVRVSGSEGDSFVFAGWAKGNSAPIDSENTEGKSFAILCRFLYDDGSLSEPHAAQFNPDSDEWQYAAGGIVAKKDYMNVHILVVYGYNVNTALFDGIQLFKQEFGTTFSDKKEEDGKTITTVTDCNNKKTSYTYDEKDRVEKEELPTGEVITYEYDDYDNLEKIVNSDGLEYIYSYDTYGNKITETVTGNGKTKVTNYTYSADGHRLEKVISSDGLEVAYEYNSSTGVLLWVDETSDGKTVRTVYEYDPMYRKTKESAWDVLVEGTNRTVIGDEPLAEANYTYENDTLKSIATPTTTYHFAYNEFSQRTEVRIGNRVLANYTYSDDQNRQLLSLDYGNDDYVQYTYDEKGRVIKQTYEDNDTVTYTYDNAGTVATVTDSSSGISSTVIYDYQDRLSRYTETGGNHDLLVRFKYDSENRVKYILYMVDNNLSSKAHNSEFTYDDKDRIQTYRKGNGKITYTYDLFGRTTSTSLTHSGGNILSTTYGFAGADDGQISDRITSLTKDAQDYDVTYEYTYDARGNILTVYDGLKTTSYKYDSQNQLIREDNEAGNFTHTWAYDNAGNILFRYEYPYTAPETEPVNPTKTVPYVYLGNSENASNKEAISTDNAWGDTLLSYNRQNIKYDAIGNPTSMGGKTFQWEHGRELASLTENGKTWNFTYNADGLRTKRTNGTLTYDYVYYGGQLMYMMVKDTGAQSPTKGNHHFILSYTPEGIPMGITYQGTAYYYLTNLQGDVVAILNNQGQRIISYTYDAWGNPLSTEVHVLENDEDYAEKYAKYSTIAAFNPLRYRGYVYDEETGLYYLQSRYYNPEIGRWLNADVVVASVGSAQGCNIFAYCFNNPVNMSDPTGCWPSWNDIKSELKKAADWVNDNIVQPVASFVMDIVEDVENFDIFNTNEQKVLDSNYFSSYKGVLTIRTDGDRSGSFGAMFITRETNNRSNPEDIVRHEYGHTVQLAQLGTVNYALCIALPSWQEWGSNPNYYARPWEITADIYGGVQSRNHSPSDIQSGFAYLGASFILGPLVWLFIE